MVEGASAAGRDTLGSPLKPGDSYLERERTFESHLLCAAKPNPGGLRVITGTVKNIFRLLLISN